MSGIQLPEGLPDMRPGRRLARLLSTLDPTRLNGWQLGVVLDAQNRQLAHDQARMLATARELAYAPPCEPDSPPDRQAESNPFVGTEISMALTWTEYAGASLAEVAEGCVDRLPDLHTAMLAGRVDLPKVRLIVTELAEANDEHARRIVTRLLPELHRCTTSQLRAMLRRLLLRLDPDAVRKRHRRAVTDRAVTHLEFTATNTAALSANNLPIPTAAAAYNHLDAIARATKAAGDPRTLDQIRADVFTDLLTGIDPTTAGTATTPALRKSTIHLHLDLATLAMLSEEPGEIEGFGPILADIARQTAAQLADTAAWRFTITDHNLPVAEGALNRSNARHAAALTHLLLGPDGRLRTDRDGYRPTTAQDNYVKARDHTCRAPGCSRPARRCDIDHTNDWCYSHDTTIANLGCLCRRHHRAKHIGLHKLRRGAHGTDWTTPHGHRYTVIPHNTAPPSQLERTFLDHAHGTPSKLRR
jgi:Domain of unknown function (DUF222)